MGKVAVVGVVGRTNAGKSTLVNRLVGEKVSIVSPVEQTTRNTVRGIVADPRGQLVLLDTPGLHKAVGTLGRLLNRMARRSAAGTDITCVVFDAAQEPQLEDIGWMQRIAREKPEKVVFVLNKADRAPFFETMYRDAWEDARRETVDVESSVSSLKSVTPVWVKAIATTEGGAKAVMDALFDFAEEGEPLFDDDIVTDYPRKLAIADSIREKYLAKMHQEVPHEMGILVKKITESQAKVKGEHSTCPVWEVDVEVLVNRASQKPIVIGKGAETVKYVRKCAERELSDIFGVKVALEIWVRVEPNWMKNERRLSEMGYLGELV
ncbi:MAG: GTPase Era [Kiritimatiellae bacterium]|nr:GTPase Era [Kiritimatiellia bacterium]